MKYALVNDHKTEPQPKFKGVCAHCKSEVIARCGRQRIWHWAHKSKMSCDPWWENETEWHREWKNLFPTEWQEACFTCAETGERHIADICTDKGLVVEFQHSYLKPDEQEARERFYKNMVWVVDGSRLKRDFDRFCRGKEKFERVVQGVFHCRYPEECFHKVWLEKPIAVFFDFEGANTSVGAEKLVWCLLPGRIQGKAIVWALKQSDFVAGVCNDTLVKYLLQVDREIQKLSVELPNVRERQLMDPISIRMGRRRYRRL